MTMTDVPRRRPAQVGDQRLRGSCPGRWCRCLACSDRRAAQGLLPLPVVIGKHVFDVLPDHGRPR